MTSATHSAAKRNCQISTDGLSGSEGRVWGDVVGRTSGPFLVLVGGVVLGKAAVDVGKGEGRRTTGVEALRERERDEDGEVCRGQVRTCQTSATKRSQKRIRRRWTIFWDRPQRALSLSRDGG